MDFILNLVVFFELLLFSFCIEDYFPLGLMTLTIMLIISVTETGSLYLNSPLHKSLTMTYALYLSKTPSTS